MPCIVVTGILRFNFHDPVSKFLSCANYWCVLPNAIIINVFERFCSPSPFIVVRAFNTLRFSHYRFFWYLLDFNLLTISRVQISSKIYNLQNPFIPRTINMRSLTTSLAALSALFLTLTFAAIIERDTTSVDRFMIDLLISNLGRYVSNASCLIVSSFDRLIKSLLASRSKSGERAYYAPCLVCHHHHSCRPVR